MHACCFPFLASQFQVFSDPSPCDSSRISRLAKSLVECFVASSKIKIIFACSAWHSKGNKVVCLFQSMGKLNQSPLKQDNNFRTSRSEQLDHIVSDQILPQHCRNYPIRWPQPYFLLVCTVLRGGFSGCSDCSGGCASAFAFAFALLFADAGAALLLGSGIVFWRDSRVKLSWPLSGRMGKHEEKELLHRF